MVHSNVAAELANIDRQFPMMPNPQVFHELFNIAVIFSSHQPGDFSLESQDWGDLWRCPQKILQTEHMCFSYQLQALQLIPWQCPQDILQAVEHMCLSYQLKALQIILLQHRLTAMLRWKSIPCSIERLSWLFKQEITHFLCNAWNMYCRKRRTWLKCEIICKTYES